MESLGAVESLAECPSLMTHASVPDDQRALLGIDDNLIRLFIGIESCRDLLALYNDRDRASSDVKRIAMTHLDEIDRKIAELTDMRKTLAHLVSACAGNDRPDCPILADLGAPVQS